MAEAQIERISLDDSPDECLQESVLSCEDCKKNESSKRDEGESTLEYLPSKITDRKYIYMPRSFENFEEREEWKSSGKWMVFSHGDLEKLDLMWIQLQPLLANETLICLKSSTATDPVNGVIICYTSNCEDRKAVKRAADAIRNVIDIEYLIFYKTNEASDSGLYKMHGDNHIAKYMHTVACSLYERGRNKRWKKISFESNDSQLPN